MKKHLLSIISIIILSLCAAAAADPTIGRLICATGGAPLANCVVRVEFRDSNGTVSGAGTTTDANGRFIVTLECANASGTNRHFYVTSPCCGHPWIIPSDKCWGDLGDLRCQECDTQPCLPPPPNMVDWWTFDEPAIGPVLPVANDIAGLVNNKGFHINGPTPIAAGKVRGALCFDGVDDWVQVRDHAEVNFFGTCLTAVGAEDLTIDAWVRVDANALDTRMPIVDKRVRPQNPVGYFLYIANGHLAFQMSDGVSIGNYVEPGASITPGAWHLVAVTVDRCNGVGTLYVDGAPVLVFEPLRGNIANDSDLFIGRLSPPFGDVFLRGCLDELEFFKRALKPDEIAALYAADSRGKCRPCVVLRCPEDIRVVSCEDKTPVDYEVTVINLCNSNITVKCDPPSGSLFPVGITPVVCEARDPAGNVIDRCGFNVIVVRDTTPPEIHCPSNQTYWVCSPNGGIVNYTVTATDDYDTNVTIVCVPPSGSAFPPGVHTVHCQAFDDCQNESRCEFTVTVRVDSEPPKIECPPDIRVLTCESSAVVNYTVTASDDSGSVAVVCVPPSGSSFPLGTTTVLCRAVDRCDHESRCEFKVTVVRDTTPPEIHCPSNQTYWVCSPNGGIINYTVTATDDYDTNVTIVCVPPSGSFFTPGVHLVQCRAFDDCQNTSGCEFTVTVRVDTEPPKIECPPDIRKFTCDSNAVVVTYTDTATDDSGSVTVTCVPPSGSAFPPGTTTVICRAVDRCDRESRCEFRVSIIPDLQPPQIHCPSNITVVTTCTNVAQVNYTVTATDNFDTNVTIVCVPPSGSIFPVGVTTVTCTAADDCGNRSECSFKVRVRHVLAPALSIYRLPSGKIAVCWPVTAPGFQLQAADHINTTPPPWVDVPGAPAIVGSEYCVTFEPNQRHRFFRLRCAGVVRVDEE